MYQRVIKINQIQAFKILLLDFQIPPRLRFVRIFFDTPTFDMVTKDRAAKFVDILYWWYNGPSDWIFNY